MPRRVRSNQSRENTSVANFMVGHIVEQVERACLQVKYAQPANTMALEGCGCMHSFTLLRYFYIYQRQYNSSSFQWDRSSHSTLCIHGINKWEVGCLASCLAEALNKYS